MRAMVSHITGVYMSFTQPFAVTQIKEMSKLRVTGRCAGELTGVRWIPRTKGQ